MARVATNPDSAGSTNEAIAVALGLGLWSGVIEAAIVGFRINVLGQFLVMNRDFPWMMPLATVLVFSVLAVIAAVTTAVRWLPWRSTLSVFGLGFVAFFGPADSIPSLADYAKVLLAAGLAVQLGRMSQWSIPRLYRRGRLATVVLAVTVVVVAVGMTGAASAERSEEGRLVVANATGPNVILVVMDTVRAKSVSAFGYGKPTTPNLEQIAREGVAFDWAFSTAPWTLPAHATLFTGKYPHEHLADWSKPLSDRDLTLAEQLGKLGYLTAGFSANTLNVTRAHGLARGFLHFEDLPVSFGRLALSISLGRRLAGQGTIRHWLNYHEVIDRQSAEQITGNFLTWLEGHQSRPFFGFLNYFDAHDPYLPPEPFASKFGPRRRPDTRFWHTADAAWPDARQQMSESDRRAEVAAYDGAIAYIDNQLGRIVAFLRQHHLLDNTLLIVTSDHGEQLGEHGYFNHGNSLHRPLVHVPLVMRLPERVPAGRRITDAVTIRDIPATIIDLIGDAMPSGLPGRSLGNYWRNHAAGSPASAVIVEGTRRPFGKGGYPLMDGNMISAVARGHQFIRHENGTEELFDLSNDPEEGTNLADTNPELIEWFRKSLGPLLSTRR